MIHEKIKQRRLARISERMSCTPPPQKDDDDRISWVEMSFYITGGLIILAGLLELLAVIIMIIKL